MKKNTSKSNFVVHLSAENFKKYSESKEYLLVDFSTKWCGFCKRFSPVFEDAAAKLRLKLPQVELAQVDCQTDGKKICKEQGIKVVPTVYLFQKGQKTNEFNRKGNADDIVKFMNDAVNKKKDKVSTSKTTKTTLKADQKEKKIASLPQKDPYARTGIIYKLTPASFGPFINTKSASLVDFYAPWCIHCKHFAPIYKEAAARLYREIPQVQLGKVDCIGAGREVCYQEQIKAYPTVWLYIGGKKVKEYSGKMTPDSIVKFMSEFVYNTPMFKDQQVPMAKPSPVCKAADQPTAQSNVLTFTDQDFTSEVLRHKATLVDFYAPWCPYCKAFVGPFSKAADVLKKELPNVALAAVDCIGKGKETCKNMKVNAYPTVVLFQQGESKMKPFQGERTAAGIIKFMKNTLKSADKPVNHILSDSPPNKPLEKQCRPSDKRACADQSLTKGSTVIELNDANFVSAVSKQTLTLVDFYTGWCCDCKNFAPAFEEAASRLKSVLPNVEFARINCADLGKTTCKAIGINWYPTVVLYKGGQRVSELRTEKTAETVVQFVQAAAGHAEALTPMTTALVGLH